jgi:hypothetical protein
MDTYNLLQDDILTHSLEEIAEYKNIISIPGGMKRESSKFAIFDVDVNSFYCCENFPSKWK